MLLVQTLKVVVIQWQELGNKLNLGLNCLLFVLQRNPCNSALQHSSPLLRVIAHPVTPDHLHPYVIDSPFHLHLLLP